MKTADNPGTLDVRVEILWLRGRNQHARLHEIRSSLKSHKCHGFQKLTRFWLKGGVSMFKVCGGLEFEGWIEGSRAGLLRLMSRIQKSCCLTHVRIKVY